MRDLGRPFHKAVINLSPPFKIWFPSKTAPISPLLSFSPNFLRPPSPPRPSIAADDHRRWTSPVPLRSLHRDHPSPPPTIAVDRPIPSPLQALSPPDSPLGLAPSAALHHRPIPRHLLPSTIALSANPAALADRDGRPHRRQPCCPQPPSPPSTLGLASHSLASNKMKGSASAISSKSRSSSSKLGASHSLASNKKKGSTSAISSKSNLSSSKRKLPPSS